MHPSMHNIKLFLSYSDLYRYSPREALFVCLCVGWFARWLFEAEE
jgi:hypothetical protein